jgi:Icc-related predicted phosphoesterase
LTKVFFATDIHGSEICWKKFISAGKFYEADILILGGDISGKAVVPIIKNTNGTFKSILLEQETIMHSEEDVLEMEKRVRSRGYYPYRTNPDEMDELRADPAKIHELFLSLVLKTATQWLSYAEEKLAGSGIRCYVSPGNDDMFEFIDPIREGSKIK